MNQMGKFVLVEGLDGCGKGTNAANAFEQMSKYGQTVHTREPGGTPFAEELREVILSKRHAGTPTLSDLMVMYAARVDHVQNFILPNLRSGINVLCERYYMSSMAYNDCPELSDLHFLCMPKLIEPDLTIYLDIDVETSRERVRQRKIREGADPDRIELRPREYFETVRANYIKLSAALPNVVTINATASREVVAEHVRTVIASTLRK